MKIFVIGLSLLLSVTSYANQFISQMTMDKQGEYYCGPAAMTNALLFFQNKIELKEEFSTPEGKVNIMRFLGSKSCMDTDTNKTTNTTNMFNGLKKCLADITDTNLKIEKHDLFKSSFNVILETVDQGNTGVILLSLFDKKDEDYTRRVKGSHFLLITGHNTKNNKTVLSVIDSNDFTIKKVSLIKSKNQIILIDGEYRSSGHFYFDKFSLKEGQPKKVVDYFISVSL